MTQPDESRVVGRVPFVDGVTRDVYEDDDGRQWVAGVRRGARVRGVAAAGGRAGSGGQRTSLTSQCGVGRMGCPLSPRSP